MERIRCPNPKCGRHILDIEEMPPGRTVLEIKCRHCGEVVEVGFGPKKGGLGLIDLIWTDLDLIWTFKNKKSAIHVARLTIHEVDVRNRPYFSDKLVEDWRWQKR